MKIIFAFFLIAFCNLDAMFVGDPASPCMYQKGIVFSKNKYAILRGAYVYYDLYKGRFKDQFNIHIPGLPHNFQDARDQMNMTLQAGMLTVTLQKRFDIYGFMGGADSQINGQFFSQRELAKGVGFKAIIFKWKQINFAFDGKYFVTKQQFPFVVSDGVPYQIVQTDTSNGKFFEKYQEWQGALGVSYLTNFITPYFGLTFLYAMRIPSTRVFFVEIPDSEPTSADTKPTVSSRNWGMFLGATLLAKKEISLNVEARMFDQNSFSFIAEIRL
ncbi:MAG: hypothetical protein HZB76_05130 [Chlamydiae bacterium]|nr:hypothetical protein [Chlamydiota bacterium]